MKTVQEHLREADRIGLLDAVAYDTICNSLLLLEYPDNTIAEIQDASKERMNDLIEHLLSIEAVPTDHMVLYMVPATSFDRQLNHDERSLCLIDLNEVRNDIYSASYAFELTAWTETLGYLVADNKLTQDYITDLLKQYLHEISFFGADPELHREEVEKVNTELDQAMKEIDEGHIIPAEDVFEELRKEHGLPLDEKDEKMDALKSKIIEAEIGLHRYCNWRERSRILESLGETAPPFEAEWGAKCNLNMKSR
ncbi:MAG: hypothetical protein IJ153_01835 [Clostridia bacterium]|nr:hypothetical protein [Clostridia bacterium]